MAKPQENPIIILYSTGTLNMLILKTETVLYLSYFHVTWFLGPYDQNDQSLKCHDLQYCIQTDCNENEQISNLILKLQEAPAASQVFYTPFFTLSQRAKVFVHSSEPAPYMTIFLNDGSQTHSLAWGKFGLVLQSKMLVKHSVRLHLCTKIF